MKIFLNWIFLGNMLLATVIRNHSSQMISCSWMLKMLKKKPSIFTAQKTIVKYFSWRNCNLKFFYPFALNHFIFFSIFFNISLIYIYKTINSFSSCSCKEKRKFIHIFKHDFIVLQFPYFIFHGLIACSIYCKNIKKKQFTSDLPDGYQ